MLSERCLGLAKVLLFSVLAVEGRTAVKSQAADVLGGQATDAEIGDASLALAPLSLLQRDQLLSNFNDQLDRQYRAEKKRRKTRRTRTRAKERAPVHIALLLAVSTRNAQVDSPEETDLLKIFYPRFLESVAKDDGFKYTFYLAFDVGDSFYDSVEQRAAFEDAFHRSAGTRPIGLRWVSVPPYLDRQHGPVKAWNLAFQEAFSDGAEYFYQLGDDVQLVTEGWAPAFVNQLQRQRGLGAVGPRETKFQAATGLLSNAMVSQSHMRIFGTFYPTRMHNWWSDNWLMSTYKPFALVTQLPDYEIKNTHDAVRYHPSEADKGLLDDMVARSHAALSRYVQLTGADLPPAAALIRRAEDR